MIGSKVGKKHQKARKSTDENGRGGLVCFPLLFYYGIVVFYKKHEKHEIAPSRMGGGSPGLLSITLIL